MQCLLRTKILREFQCIPRTGARILTLILYMTLLLYSSPFVLLAVVRRLSKPSVHARRDLERRGLVEIQRHLKESNFNQWSCSVLKTQVGQVTTVYYSPPRRLRRWTHRPPRWGQRSPSSSENLIIKGKRHKWIKVQIQSGMLVS